jgi:hypothetical protein
MLQHGVGEQTETVELDGMTEPVNPDPARLVAINAVARSHLVVGPLLPRIRIRGSSPEDQRQNEPDDSDDHEDQPNRLDVDARNGGGDGVIRSE